MKLARLFVVIALAGAGAMLAVPVVAGPDEAGTDAVKATCIRVVDGDTIVVRCDKRQMTIDLVGVDAPELGQPWGREVRTFVRDMVEGNQVTVEILAAGESGGTARVLVGGEDMSRLLAERGLAWATAGGELQDLVDKARSAPCGLWRDAEPVPPWQFRESAA